MSCFFLSSFVAGPAEEGGATATPSSQINQRSLRSNKHHSFLSLGPSYLKNRTIEVRLDEIEQDTQCAVCLGELFFLSFFN